MHSFFAEYFRILKAVGFPVLILLNLAGIVDQSLTRQLEIIMRHSEGPGPELWAIAGAALLSSLLFPTLVTALALFGLYQARGWVASLQDYLGRVSNALYIEVVRAWGSCLRWGLLLILPGLVRLFQLAFVPMVVTAHRGYEEGRADALKTSTSYVNRRWIRLSGLVFVFQVIVPLALTQVLDPWRSYVETPFAAVATSVVDLLLAILFAQILFRVFDGVRQEVGDELVFQLEGTSAAGQGSHL